MQKRVEKKCKDFLSIRDLNKKEFERILELAKYFKRSKKFPKILENKNLLLILQKPSTRTKISFWVAISKLGGKPICLGLDETANESIAEIGKLLEKYINGIIARVISHNDLIETANKVNIPVINALSDFEHPCQTLADLLTIDEKIGFEKVEKIAYVGDGASNVCHSLILACDMLKLPLVVGSPEGYTPAEEIMRKVSSTSVKIINTAIEAVKGADVIYTDVWISMGKESERSKRMKIFLPYQVNARLAKFAKENFIFMHCLPAMRGQEVTDEIIDSQNSVVFDQAENRLWTQMALLSLLIK